MLYSVVNTLERAEILILNYPLEDLGPGISADNICSCSRKYELLKHLWILLN